MHCQKYRGMQWVVKVTIYSWSRYSAELQLPHFLPSIPPPPPLPAVTQRNLLADAGLGNISESGQDFTTPDTVSFSVLFLTKELLTRANCQVCSGFVRQTVSQGKLYLEHHSF